MIGALAGGFVGFMLLGPNGIIPAAFVGGLIFMALEPSAPSVIKRRDYTQVIPRVIHPGVRYGPIIDMRAPSCAYCGRHGTLHANCDGCGAQVAT